jgi:hypothetical protein
MIIVRLLSPEPLVGQHHQLYSGVRADIVMESTTLIDVCGTMSAIALFTPIINERHFAALHEIHN